MTERMYRLTMGLILLCLLYLDIEYLYYAYIAVMMLEGITNLRVSFLVSRLRWGKNFREHLDPLRSQYKVNFEAERAMRIAFSGMLAIILFVLPEAFWPGAWALGGFVALAGLVNLCPTVITFRALGFR